MMLMPVVCVMVVIQSAQSRECPTVNGCEKCPEAGDTLCNDAQMKRAKQGRAMHKSKQKNPMSSWLLGGPLSQAR